MEMKWYYEYSGKKTGPVPSATLRHLAKHGAISQQTQVWKEGMQQPVKAARVKNLFGSEERLPHDQSTSPEEAVFGNLCEAFDACRDEDEERLEHQVPSIAAIHPFSVSAILLEYDIVSVTRLPNPPQDPSLPPERQTQPVRQLHEAIVRVTLCDRPSFRTSLEEIRRLQPGRREETVAYEWKEFEDGEWLLIDASLTR